MIALIALFFILVTFDLNISIFTKKNVTFFPIIVSSIILILYIFGLFNQLILGFYFICSLIVLNLFFLILNFKNHKINLNDIFRHRYVALGLYLMFIFYVNHGNKLLCYDEFSAWGLYIKNTFNYDSLHVFSPHQMAAKAYFPGTTLFIYFLLKLKGFISEELMINGLNIIYFALISTLFDRIAKKNIAEFFKIFLISLLIPLSVNMWPTPTSVILTDALLGCSFAYCLYFHYTNKFNKYYILNLSFALFLLNSIKATGIILSFLFLLIVLVDIIFFRKNEFKKQFLKNNKIFNIIFLFLPMFAIGFGFVSWSFILDKLSLTNVVPTSFNILSDYFLQSLLACLKVIFTQAGSYFYSFLLIFAGIYIYLKNKFAKNKKVNRKTKRFIAFVLIYVCSGIIYSIFLTIVIVTQMPKELAIRAEGLVRYLCTYILATNMLFACLFIDLKNTKKVWLFSSSTLVLIILLQFTISTRFFINLIERKHVYEANVYRRDYENIKKIKNFIDKEKDIVYFVGVNEIDILIANYNIYPISLSKFIFQAEKNQDQNLLILPVNQYFKSPFVSWRPQSKVEKERMNKLNGKLWLYVFRFNDEFKDNFGEFFIGGQSYIKNDSLYSIDINNGSFVFNLYQ